MSNAAGSAQAGPSGGTLTRTLGGATMWVLGVMERFVASRWWLAKVTLVATAISLFHAFPAYDTLNPDHPNWKALLLQADDPFQPHDYPPESHAAKLALRLTTPIVGHVFGFGVAGFLIYNALAGIALLALVAHVANTITGDRVVAALASIAVGLTLAGSLGFTALNATIDAPALALLVAALALRSSVAIAVVTLVAGFTDERALLGSALVLLFHRMRRESWVNAQTVGVVVGVAAYAVLRVVITHATGLETPRGGISPHVIVNQYVGGPLSAWSALAALWALVLAGMIVLWLRHAISDLVFMALAIAAVLIAALMVGDTARSMAYGVPVVLVALFALRGQSLSTTRKVMLWICVISFLPNYYVDQKGPVTHASLEQPAPIQAIREVANR